MALLSSDTLKRLAHALTSKSAAQEVADSMNQGASAASQDVYCQPALIVATNVSTTIDFAALRVSDKVLHIPATAGNSNFLSVAVAGTLPAAAVVGDLYVVIRAFSAPAASSIIL